MDYDDDEPELTGYVPASERPLRNPRVLLVMRVIVIVGIGCLILPGILTTATVAASTAHEACVAWVRYEDPGSAEASARFEFFGPGGVGWQCYAVGGFGGDRQVAFLGLIPISPSMSPVPMPGTLARMNAYPPRIGS